MDAVRGIKSLGLFADASVGILRAEQLIALRDAGLDAYHHNLETARSHFPSVCTTHDYDEDIDTIHLVKAHGLQVMSIGFLIDQATPMVWRGPMVSQALQQLLRQSRRPRGIGACSTSWTTPSGPPPRLTRPLTPLPCATR